MSLRIKAGIMLHLDGYVVAIVSLLFGFQILMYPFILEQYKVYQLIQNIFNNKVIGIAFMLFAGIKLVGLFIGNHVLKKWSMKGLLFLWILLFLAFIVTPPPNIIWIIALGNVILAVGVIMKEG